MGNAVPVERITNVNGLVDRSYLARLCEEIKNTLHEQRDFSIFSFLYRYFQTLIQQERLEEVQLFIDGLEQHPFAAYTDHVVAFAGYIKAFLCKSQGKSKESGYWFRQSLVKHSQLESLGIRNVQVLCYKELGNIEYYRARYKDAIENYQSAINSLKLDQDSDYLLAILMYNISLCQYNIKNYQQTLEYIDKVIPLAKETSNSTLLMDTLIWKSVLLTERYKRYQESNELLEQAYEIAERNQRPSSIINKIWNNWGHNFFHLKQYVLAEQALQHSIKISQENGDLKVGLGSELLRAEIWIAQGRKKQAKTLLESIKEKASNKPECKEELIDCLELMEQLEDSADLRFKYLREALKLASEQKNYQKTTKFQKKLSELSRIKEEF